MGATGPAAEEAGANPTAVDSDGYVYDVVTGEVLGRAELPEGFAVDSAERAEWVLELRSRIDADIAAVDARLRALTENLQAVRREKLRRLAWWELRFGPSLVAFARSALSGKSRTARFAWGSVAFRKTPGSNQIADMPAAVAWLKSYAPELIEVRESAKVKDVLAVRDAVEADTGEGVPLPFLVSSPPGENVTVSTGVAPKEDRP